MEFEALFTPRSQKQASTLGRTWLYWPHKIIRSYRAFIFVLCILFTAAHYLEEGLTSSPVNYGDIGIGVLVLAISSGAVFWAYYSEHKEKVKALATQKPVTYLLESTGIVITDRKTSVPQTMPWTLFTHFSAKEHLTVLKFANSKKFHIIPTDGLSPMQTGQLRSILLSHLPER